MTHQLFNPSRAILMTSGVIRPSWRVRFFLTGTTTPTPVYTTSDLDVTHTQPVQADSGGVLAAIYLDPAISYKASYYDQNDVLQYTDDPVNDNLLSQASIGLLLYPRTAAEIAAGVTPTNYAYPPRNVLRYGADPTGAGDSTAAFQTAIDVAIAEGAGSAEVYIPRGTYRITATLHITGNINGVVVRGEGSFCTRIVSEITGAGADPLFLIDASANYFTFHGLYLRGNNITGSGGNGHAIACINPGSVLAPQVVRCHDMQIHYFRGTGKDESGASVPACGFFAFKSTAYVWESVDIRWCAQGLRLHDMENCDWFGGTIDACDNNCIFLQDCHAINFHGGSFQSSGSGGAKDGVFFADGCNSINFFGGEFKNGNPYLVNLTGSVTINQGLSFDGMYLSQLDVDMGHTAIACNNAQERLSIRGCRFLFFNALTDAVGVVVGQEADGFNMGGLIIERCQFTIGGGASGVIAKAIHFNVSSNRLYSPVVRSNVFGQAATLPATATITDAIYLDGRVVNALIENNTFIAGTGQVLVTAVNVASANVQCLRMRGNSYGPPGHSIAALVNGGGVVVDRQELDFGRLLTGAATFNPGNINAGSGASSNVTVTGAALGDVVEAISWSADLQGMTVTGYVSAANTVTLRFQNGTEAAIDLGSGTAIVHVRKET